jgi:hypothetical protein
MMEALYGELGPAERARFDVHLAACPDCAAEYSLLGATLRIMDRKERPDPGQEFWDGYWDRLEARMNREEMQGAAPRRRTGLLGRLSAAWPRWSFQAAAAVLLITAGILIGRWVLAPPAPYAVRPGGREPAAGLVRPAASEVEARAGDYLERSKILLLGLVNFDPKTDDAYALDLPGKRQICRALATQAADLRSSLTAPRQIRLRGLVSDLQVIMMQIANLASGQDLEGVDLVRRGVEQKGIFLRIDLTRMARGPQPGGPSLPSARPSRRPGDTKL